MQLDRVPEKFVAPVQQLHELMMSKGLVGADLSDESPLVELVQTEGLERSASDARRRILRLIKWLAHEGSRPEWLDDSDGLGDTDAQILRRLMALGEYAELPSLERRRAAMQLAYGRSPNTRLMTSEARLAENERSRRNWDTYRKKGESDLYRRVCQLLIQRPRTGHSLLEPVVAPQGYFLNRYRQTYILPRGEGDLLRYETERQLTATEEIAAFRQHRRTFGYDLSHSEAVLFGPGALEVTNSQPFTRGDKQGMLTGLEVTWAKSLQPGDETTFSIVEQVPGLWDSLIPHLERSIFRDMRYLAPTLTIADAVIQVVFPPGRLPGRVWYFEDLPEWLAPGTPGEREVLTPDVHGFVEKRWRRPTLGLATGIGWSW